MDAYAENCSIWQVGIDGNFCIDWRSISRLKYDSIKEFLCVLDSILKDAKVRWAPATPNIQHAKNQG